MSMLASFEQQYSSLTAEMTSKIGRLSMVSGPERRETVAAVEGLATEVEDVLDQMELAIRELPATERPKYDVRLKSYRKDKASLSKELSSALERLGREESRDALLGSPSSSGPGARLTADQRSALMNNTETLERCSRKLDESRRVAIETEEVGAGVLSDLAQQRQTLTRSHNRLRDAEEEIGQSSQVLNAMIRRVIQNRLLMWGVGALILLVVLVAFWSAVS